MSHLSSFVIAVRSAYCVEKGGSEVETADRGTEEEKTNPIGPEVKSTQKTSRSKSKKYTASLEIGTFSQYRLQEFHPKKIRNNESYSWEYK